MLHSKVACVEDFDSQVQEAVPASRIQAFRKRQSGLASVTNYSDAGTVDSGYSSNSAPNLHEEQEIYPDHDSPSRHTPQSDLSNSNISERTPVNRPLSIEGDRPSRGSSSSNRTSGKYAFVPQLNRIDRVERPLSRSASKSERAGRASPAVRPIDADECDCAHCAKAPTSAQPSPSIPPPDAALDSNWSLDMLNSLPSYNPNSLDLGHSGLSSSPGKNRGLGRENHYFDSFPSNSASNASGNGRPSSLLSNSNPLASFTSSYDYMASPSTYTPSSAVNPLLSPPPYTGVDDSAWMAPNTPTSLRNNNTDDYLSYTGSDYLYGHGSTLSANGGNHTSYDLPPRSASVQPPGVRNRPRSSTYHVEYPMGPPTRRVSSKMPAGPKRLHSASNSYDSRFDGYGSYDSPYDGAGNGEDFHAPAHPINRRLSRNSGPGPAALPPLDITRATSVPPADNYVTGLERARRMTSMTPQPLAITNRDRNRRGSNASSGMSSSASRRAHEARMAEMMDSIKIEPRPELALAKRESSGAIVKHGAYPTDYDYAAESPYGAYDYQYDNSGMELAPYHHEEFGDDALVLSGHSDPYSSRYGLPPKLHYANGDPLHRSLRLSSDRRRSVHRRLSDYQHASDPYGHGNELEELRQLTKSRGSGLDRRLAHGPAYIDDTY